jgi:hypothetical protein
MGTNSRYTSLTMGNTSSTQLSSWGPTPGTQLSHGDQLQVHSSHQRDQLQLHILSWGSSPPIYSSRHGDQLPQYTALIIWTNCSVRNFNNVLTEDQCKWLSTKLFILLKERKQWSHNGYYKSPFLLKSFNNQR